MCQCGALLICAVSFSHTLDGLCPAGSSPQLPPLPGWCAATCSHSLVVSGHMGTRSQGGMLGKNIYPGVVFWLMALLKSLGKGKGLFPTGKHHPFLQCWSSMGMDEDPGPPAQGQAVAAVDEKCFSSTSSLSEGSTRKGAPFCDWPDPCQAVPDSCCFPTTSALQDWGSSVASQDDQTDLSTVSTWACSIQGEYVHTARGLMDTEANGKLRRARHLIYHNCTKINRKCLQSTDYVLPSEINMRNPTFYLINPRQAGLLGPGTAGALRRPEALLAAPATLHERRCQQALAAGPEMMAARPLQRDPRYLSRET